MTSDTNRKQNSEDEAGNIQVGDLVRVRDHDWLGQEIGIVIEIKNLVHEQSGAKYRAITTVVGNESYTFSGQDFELVSKTERKEID
tara:strand:+ start:618 stop:875 length:258 start_codon:yes stop_codon:yes gene_type:complete